MARRTPTKDLSVDVRNDVDFLKLFVYSESGAGKTVFGGSEPEPRSVLYISPDPHGPQSARRVHGVIHKRWPIHEWDDIDKCAEFWYEHSIVNGEPIPYKWFCIDTLTEVQDLGMDSILAAAVKQNPSRDPYIPALQDYMKNQLMILRLVKAFNELPVNVLYTAWTMQYTDSDGNEVLIPDIRGGAKKGHTVSKEVCGLMTSFGHMQLRRVTVNGEKKEVRRITWENRATKTDGLITGKDRTQVLKPYTDDITLKEIRERVDASNTEDKGSATPKPAPRRTARKTTGSRRVSSTQRKGTTRG